MGVGFSLEGGGVLEWELDFLRRVVGFLNESWIFLGGW